MKKQPSSQASPQKRPQQFSVITNKYMDQARQPEMSAAYSHHAQENISSDVRRHPISPAKHAFKKQESGKITQGRPSSGVSPVKKTATDFTRAQTKSPQKLLVANLRPDSNIKRRATQVGNEYGQFQSSAKQTPQGHARGQGYRF